MLNILPREIAAILKEENRVIADQFEGASILFADVVNFTPMSAAMSPVQHPSGVVAIGRARPADLRVVMSAVTASPLVVVLAGLQDPDLGRDRAGHQLAPAATPRSAASRSRTMWSAFSASSGP